MLTNFAEQTTRMISINFGFGHPLMVETCFEVAEPDKTLVGKSLLDVVNHPYQLTSLRLPFCPKRMWSSRWRRRDYHRWKLGKCFKIPQKESGTDEGLGTVWLVGWMDTLFLNHHIISSSTCASTGGIQVFSWLFEEKKYLDPNFSKRRFPKRCNFTGI